MGKLIVEDMKMNVSELKQYLASLPDDTMIYFGTKNIKAIKFEDFKRDIYGDEEGSSLYISVQ